MAQKQQAALAGQIYNPTFGFVPVGNLKKPVYNVDYKDFAPRLSARLEPIR